MSIGTMTRMLMESKPMTDSKRKKLTQDMLAGLESGKGSSLSFKFKIGDKVEDFVMFSPPAYAGIVTENYRENGHNKVLTTKGVYREKDLQLRKEIE